MHIPVVHLTEMRRWSPDHEIDLCGCQPWAEEGMALLEKAAAQGHAYAMSVLGETHAERKEHEQATEWFTKAAETGLPGAMYNLGHRLDSGEGGAAPDSPAAADWYKRAADAGDTNAAQNLSNMYQVGRGWAWLNMPATSPHYRPSFHEINSFL